MARQGSFKALWTRYKLTARIKVIVILFFIVMLVTPLRNALIPGWPFMFRQLSTIKVIRIHLEDLVYSVDRSPYTGPCDFVHKQLAKVKMPKLEDMPTYDVNDWDKMTQKIKPSLSADELAMLDNYKPSLTLKEQREMLFSMLSATHAFAAFNITYFITEGSLIGYWRHHGMIPWDDDVDIFFDREKWPLARQVLSCLPDLELSMGSDYMWKLYHKDSALWKGETSLKFPFVDIFMYHEDSDHVWPVCIWMKTETVLPKEWTLPVIKGTFEGYQVSLPRKPAKVIQFQYGQVASDCYSRTFLRRERQMVPFEQRTHIPCSALKSIYPFVARTKMDKTKGTVLEERRISDKVLSTFSAEYQGTLE